jgi:hypothetical protein
MGTIEDAQFANQLGQLYQSAAQQIADFLTNNIDQLEKNDIDIITDDQSRLVSYANTFYTLSDNIAFSGSDPYFAQIKAATGQISDALKTINSVNKIINIAAGIITLAAAIVSGNGKGIVSALASIIGPATSSGSSGNA